MSAIEVVDATAPLAASAVNARVAEILRTRTQPTRAYIVVPELLSGLLASPAYGGFIVPDDQRWWRCPCGRGGGCPYAVLYGRVNGSRRVGFAPAVCFEEAVCIGARAPGPDGQPSFDADILAVSIGSIDDLDRLPKRVEDAGRPGMSTMLMVWFELGLRDTLIAALGTEA